MRRVTRAEGQAFAQAALVLMDLESALMKEGAVVRQLVDVFNSVLVGGERRLTLIAFTIALDLQNAFGFRESPSLLARHIVVPESPVNVRELGSDESRGVVEDGSDEASVPVPHS
jgi:hypothetical protein